MTIKLVMLALALTASNFLYFFLFTDGELTHYNAALERSFAQCVALFGVWCMCMLSR